MMGKVKPRWSAMQQVQRTRASLEHEDGQLCEQHYQEKQG